MADPAFGGEAGSFIKEHPVGVAVGALGIVLVIWWLIASSGSSSQTASAPSDNGATAAAASLGASQIAAQAQTAQVVAASNAAQQEAYYGAATTIAENNTSVINTALTTQQALAGVGANDIAGEFATLADTLKSWGAAAQSIVSGPTNSSSSSISTTGGVSGVSGATSTSNTSTSATAGGSSTPVTSLFQQMISAISNAFSGSVAAIQQNTGQLGLGPQYNALLAANLTALTGQSNTSNATGQGVNKTGSSS